MGDMATSTQIKAYSLSDPSKAKPIIEKVHNHLRQPKYFKTALPLYRRLQFGRFLESSYLYTNRSLDDSENQNTEEPWFYAFVDRGCRPETELWLFGSWEVESAPSTNAATSEDDTPTSNGTTTTSPNTPNNNLIRSLLLSLISTIKAHPTPTPIHTPTAILTAQTQLLSHSENPTTKPTPSLPNPTLLLCGAIHTHTIPHLHSLNLLNTIALPLHPNWTFLFPLSSLPPPTELPPTLRWGNLRPSHYPLVRSRTAIARQDFTLARLPNLGIFPVEPADAPPVAWAFVGLDGSLTTLHTEAGWRRLGLGRALTAKLFREEMGGFWEEGVERVAHGNVAVGNEASAGMCRKLGGESGAEVFWVKVDLERVV